eukprot:IDg5276t1
MLDFNDANTCAVGGENCVNAEGAIIFPTAQDVDALRLPPLDPVLFANRAVLMYDCSNLLIEVGAEVLAGRSWRAQKLFTYLSSTVDDHIQFVATCSLLCCDFLNYLKQNCTIKDGK